MNKKGQKKRSTRLSEDHDSFGKQLGFFTWITWICFLFLQNFHDFCKSFQFSSELFMIFANLFNFNEKFSWFLQIFSVFFWTFRDFYKSFQFYPKFYPWVGDFGIVFLKIFLNLICSSVSWKWFSFLSLTEVGSVVDDEAMSAFSVCSSIPDSVAGPGKQLLGAHRFDDATSSLPLDGLGAVSEEMASHRSVASSVDDVIQNDNLSDVEISPIVSGRASPSVSTGRDTPSPQPGDAPVRLDVADIGDDVPVPAPPNDPAQPRLLLPRDLPVTVRRANREDVSDKFGKSFNGKSPLHRLTGSSWCTLENFPITSSVKSFTSKAILHYTDIFQHQFLQFANFSVRCRRVNS